MSREHTFILSTKTLLCRSRSLRLHTFWSSPHECCLFMIVEMNLQVRRVYVKIFEFLLEHAIDAMMRSSIMQQTEDVESWRGREGCRPTPRVLSAGLDRAFLFFVGLGHCRTLLPYTGAGWFTHGDQTQGWGVHRRRGEFAGY